MAGIAILSVLTLIVALLSCHGSLGAVVSRDAAVDRVRESLPQTQCRQCGYAGCAPYAAALMDGVAAIDRCRPGGEAVAGALAMLLGRERPRDLADGLAPRVRIDEAACIGCARCLLACPVDAILGAPRQLHVILDSWCTGCELCIPVCPVDCIQSFPAEPDRLTWRWPLPEHR